ncbi:MAG: hypothetical protein RR234_05095 [Christensenella sp.]
MLQAKYFCHSGRYIKNRGELKVALASEIEHDINDNIITNKYGYLLDNSELFTDVLFHTTIEEVCKKLNINLTIKGGKLMHEETKKELRALSEEIAQRKEAIIDEWKKHNTMPSRGIIEPEKQKALMEENRVRASAIMKKQR